MHLGKPILNIQTSGQGYIDSNLYSTTKETHQSLLVVIMENRI